ncbi:MAG: ArdC family protein [Candidatus Acidiferrales bacterium]
MNTDQAKTLSDNAVTKLMEALEGGQSETLKSYLATMSRFHRYSWNNALLIYMQCPNAMHVAGFHAWLHMRRYVRKGEKGIVILAPIVGRKKSIDDELLEDEQTKVFGFHAAHVFDISQTDGQDLPEFATVKGDPREHLQALKALVASHSIALDYDAAVAPAKGVSRGGCITLLPGQPAAEEFSTLVHELAHEKLHRAERRTETTKTIRETEAEAVAFVVCHAIGLDTNTAAADYIKLYNGDRATLSASLQLIQSTAAGILTALNASAEPLQKAAAN